VVSSPLCSADFGWYSPNAVAEVNSKSVQDTINEYLSVAETVFDVDQVLKGVIPTGDDQCRFDYRKLEVAMMRIVSSKLDDPEAVMVDERDLITPTFVVATSAAHTEGRPTLFRSYSCRGFSAHPCTIWEAARATSAAPTFFKSIKIAKPPPGLEFIDGGLTYNNPAELALEEASRIWPHADKFCLVSLGTGRMASVSLTQMQRSYDSGWDSAWNPLKGLANTAGGAAAIVRLAEACIRLSTNCEKAHQSIIRMANSPNPTKRFPYYRFNVSRDMQDIGLQEWREMNAVTEHTLSWISEGENEMLRDTCVEDLMRFSSAVSG
jgi:hypothetical protein